MEMKLPFKVYVDGRSEEIQQHLFALGCKWVLRGDTTLTHLDAPFLSVNQAKEVSSGSDMTEFKHLEHPELTVEQVLSLTIDQPARQFKPFDRVLVRGNNNREWIADIYSHYNNSNFVHICISGSWNQCIPYEGNEHLLGNICTIKPSTTSTQIYVEKANFVWSDHTAKTTPCNTEK